MKNILVTGAIGFIGSYLCNELVKNENNQVIGLDNINDYYNISLKEHRLEKLSKNNNFLFIKEDLVNKDKLVKIFKKYNPEIVINLAGYAGVRNSIKDPDKYIESNIVGFYNILDCSNKYKVKHFIYASSSSVYGDSINVPYREDENTDKPVSLYAATKKCDELIAYSYSSIYNLKTTGLRFFTVYGPIGRPDMAYYDLTNKLVNKHIITLFNNGDLKRDFTYIDDVIKCIMKVIDNKPKNNYNIYNIGKGYPNTLIEFINILKKEIVNNNLLPKDYNFDSLIKLDKMQKGDVYETHADTTKFEQDFKFKPNISLEDGIHKFIVWYKNYYNLNK